LMLLRGCIARRDQGVNRIRILPLPRGLILPSKGGPILDSAPAQSAYRMSVVRSELCVQADAGTAFSLALALWPARLNAALAACETCGAVRFSVRFSPPRSLP